MVKLYKPYCAGHTHSKLKKNEIGTGYDRGTISDHKTTKNLKSKQYYIFGDSLTVVKWFF